MFREAVILEFTRWGDGRIAIRMWLVTERRCGVRIKQLMWGMARLTYGTRYAVEMWCQSKQNLGILTFLSWESGGPPSLLTLLHFALPSAQSPALLRFCYSTWFWSCIEYTGFSTAAVWVIEVLSRLYWFWIQRECGLVDCVSP